MIATPNSLHNDGASISFNGNSVDKPLIFTEDSQMPFFHGNISREKTEKLLKNRSDGTFLIRNSTNYPGDFTLCIACNGKVEHYRIYLINGQLSCDKEEMFDNLTQLVSHYKRDSDGLCHRLVTPLVSDAFKISCESANWEDRLQEFKRAKVLIPRQEIQLGDVIGHGEFGDVLLGYYGSRKVAIKLLKNGMASDLLNEARFMIDLHHPHLVALIGVVMDESRDVYMLTEYMANGNLVDFLRSRGRHQVDRPQLLRFALNVADGMAYMESKGLVHRDLAARNILLNENYVAKISDFGLAQSMNQPVNDSVRGKFPIKWTSPEALRHSLFSNKSDVWSFGVFLWELYSFGRVPYPRIPIQDVVRHIEQGYRMEPPEGCPIQISQLMKETWALEPQNRPQFSEIVIKLRRISA
uniref:Tyrosine-protein kinase n=1 Tax=Panagrolaimus sp. JU765 TaxID=591449 RepID=A0AC34Q2G8_9BILA